MAACAVPRALATAIEALVPPTRAVSGVSSGETVARAVCAAASVAGTSMPSAEFKSLVTCDSSDGLAAACTAAVLSCSTVHEMV